MRRLAALTGILLGGLGMLVGVVVATAAPATQGAPTLNVTAGYGDQVVRLQEFLPGQLRVAVGTTVTWTVGSDDEHSVSFLAGTQGSMYRAIPQPEDRTRPNMANPLVWDVVPPTGPYDGSYRINSGSLSRGQSFSATFAEAGTYAYLCSLHAAVMTGTVEVVAPGSPVITTQQEVEAAIANRLPPVEAQVAEIMATRNTATKIEGPLGTDTWFVRAGTSWPHSKLDIDAFLPNSLTVQQGDTVVWSVDHLVPHTVTFLAPGQPRPEIWAAALPDGTMVTPGMAPPDPSVVPRLVTANRGAVRPKATYDGVSYYSSGQLGGDPPSPRGVAWALTFDTPGTFEYRCLLHDTHGMKGQITVVPR